MAPRYEPMQPFAPQVSKDYGEAEVMTRNNPVVYGAGSDTARMRERMGEASADRAERSAARGAADRNEMYRILAGKTAQDYDNLQRGNIVSGELQQRQFEQEDERQLRVNQLEFQRSAAQAEMEHQRNQVQSRAAVEQMLFQNKLTFEDQQQDAQLSRRMSEVANSNLFDDGEKAEMLRDMASRGQFTKMRVQKAQAEMLESRAKEYKSQVALQEQVSRENARVDSMSIPERTHWFVSPGFEQKYMAENPPPANADPKAQAAYREKMANAANQAGALLGYGVYNGKDANGKMQWSHHDIKSQEQAIKPQEMFSLAQDVYTGMQKEMAEAAKSDGAIKVGWENFDEEYDKRLGTIIGGMNRLMGGSGQMLTPGARKAAESQDPTAWSGGFDPANPATQSARQQEFMKQQNRILAELKTSRVPLLQRTAVEDAIQKRIAIAAKPNKTAEDIARFRALAQVGYEETPAAAVEQPATQPPRQPVFTPQALSMRGGF